MSHRSTRIAWLGVLLLALAAPSSRGQTIFGLDNGNSSPAPMLHEFTSGCATIGPPCTVTGIAPPINFPQGGVAYGTCSGTIWATDGMIQLVQMDTMCNQIQACPVPVLNGPPWSGLDIDENAGVLYFTDLLTNLGQVAIPAAGCPTQPTLVCAITGLQSVPTGVDYDEITRTFWIVDVAGFIVNITPSGTVLSSFRAAYPSGGPIRMISGIMLDPCTRLLHIADDVAGVITMTTAGAPVGYCIVPSVPNPGTNLGTLVGLAYRPAVPAVMGGGCSDPLCPPCVPVAQTSGDASPGSRCFSIDLQSAPLAGAAFLLLNVTPGPIAIPGFCGPLEVGLVPAPFFLGPIITTSNPAHTPPCDGMARVPVPIPASGAFCGATVFTQWVIGCPAAVPVFALSNGLAITIS